jgi:peptidoglycan/LPS O-acetylase OafA/YrhL
MTLTVGSLDAAGFGPADTAVKFGFWGILASVTLLPPAGDAHVNVTWSLKYKAFFYLISGALNSGSLGRLGSTGHLAVGRIHGQLLLPRGGGRSQRVLRALGPPGVQHQARVCLADRPTPFRCFARRFVALMQGEVPRTALAAGAPAFAREMAAGDHTQGHTRSTDIPCALGAVAVVIALVLSELSGRIRVPDVLVLLYYASYAIYVAHYPAVALLARVLAHVHAVATNEAPFLAAAGFGIGTGLACDQVTDQPIQSLPREPPKHLR